jgi:hypothetical protein
VFSAKLETSPHLPHNLPSFFVSSSLKGLQKTLRSKWLKGPVSKFDKLLARIAKCDLEKAEKIRESWMDLEILAYAERGLLVWYHGGY